MESITLYFFPQEPRPVFVARPPLSPQPQGRPKAPCERSASPGDSSRGLWSPGCPSAGCPCPHGCHAGQAWVAEQNRGTFPSRMAVTVLRPAAPCQWLCWAQWRWPELGRLRSAPGQAHEAHTASTAPGCLRKTAHTALGNGIWIFALAPLWSREVLWLERPGLAAPAQPRVCLKSHRAGDPVLPLHGSGNASPSPPLILLRFSCSISLKWNTVMLPAAVPLSTVVSDLSTHYTNCTSSLKIKSRRQWYPCKNTVRMYKCFLPCTVS